MQNQAAETLVHTAHSPLKNAFMDGQTLVPRNTSAEATLRQKMHRRNFLRFSGAAASLAFVAVSCKKDDDPGMSSNGGVDLGSGDTGILNYAYALEQLEAAFYTQVIATPFSGITAVESAFLADI